MRDLMIWFGCFMVIFGAVVAIIEITTRSHTRD